MNDNNLFAKALAESDSKTQAEFLNEFYRLVKCTSRGRAEQQICYIADDLDANGRELCSELYHYAQLAAESRAKTETELSILCSQRSNLETEIAKLVEDRKTLESHLRE
jgi:predicted mannosyl-3-phosphoglycerate phosphatase (HAD superfamily)